jgi:hypothetical protein
MDESSERALETSLGLAGEWLNESCLRNRRCIRDKTRRILELRGVDHIEAPNPAIIVPLVAAAENENREELQDLWAMLLATALDPNRKKLFRREFVEAVKQFDSNDVLVFTQIHIAGLSGLYEGQYTDLAEKIGLRYTQVQISFRNLIKSGCCILSGFTFEKDPENASRKFTKRDKRERQEDFPSHGVILSPLGWEMLTVVFGISEPWYSESPISPPQTNQ